MRICKFVISLDVGQPSMEYRSEIDAGFIADAISNLFSIPRFRQFASPSPHVNQYSYDPSHTLQADLAMVLTMTIHSFSVLWKTCPWKKYGRNVCESSRHGWYLQTRKNLSVMKVFTASCCRALNRSSLLLFLQGCKRG